MGSVWRTAGGSPGDATLGLSTACPLSNDDLWSTQTYTLKRNWYFRLALWKLTSFFLARSHVVMEWIEAKCAQSDTVSNGHCLDCFIVSRWQTMTRERRTVNTKVELLPGCNYPTCFDRYILFSLPSFFHSWSLSSIKIILIITGITDNEEYMQQERSAGQMLALVVCRTVVVDDWPHLG